LHDILSTVLRVASWVAGFGEGPGPRFGGWVWMSWHGTSRRGRTPGPRSIANTPLVRVVVIALRAVLAGGNRPTASAEGAALTAEFLGEVRDRPHAVPGTDVVRRVLRARKPRAFPACVAAGLPSWRTAAAAATGVEPPVRAGAGTTARRSHEWGTGWGAWQAVSVGASAVGLSLGPVAGAEKSRAIPALPQLWRRVDRNGAILPIEAIGTPKAIAAQIIAGGGDYLLARTGNQEPRHPAIRAPRAAQLEGDLAEAPEPVPNAKGPGPEEPRTDLPLPAPEDVPGFDQGKRRKSVGVVTSGCFGDGKETREVRSDISSRAVSVTQFAQAVRSHWGIEKSCHSHLEITDREDASRIGDR
jgi:predicted transposase YbfD/YdcC